MGMVLTLLGIVSVVIASFIHDKQVNGDKEIKYHLYLFLMILALLLYSFQKIGEEYILQKAEFATRRFVGLQGVIGLGIISFVQILVILIINLASSESSTVKFLKDFQGGDSLVQIGKGISNF
jgi:drug/metabolite transporter (DMT)-like permease